MEKGLYEYDRAMQWQSPQNQRYTDSYPSAHTRQSPADLQAQRPRQTGGGAQPKPPARMPKTQALALARRLKRGLLVVSLAVFASISGLAAYHQVSATTSQNSSSSEQTTPTTSSAQQNSNSFFNQQQGNNFGTNTSSSAQGSSSGSGNSSSSSPVGGSSVS